MENALGKTVMFFSYFARIVAYLALILGLLYILLGLGMANGFLEDVASFSKYTTAQTTGELIDHGIYKILFAIALGTLAELSLRGFKTTNRRR